MLLFIIYTLQVILWSESVYFVPKEKHLNPAKYRNPLSHYEASPSTHDAGLEEDWRRAQVSLNLYNMSSAYRADFRCLTMRTSPPTPVCVYDSWSDIYISHDLIETGMWESHVLLDFQADLLRDTSLGVLDIGANIGVYTLLAAKMGRKVVAVEPLRENLLRLHQAAVLAGTESQIIVLQNAISDTRGVATIKKSGTNQGDTRVKMGYEPCVGSCPIKVHTILMSDLRYILTFDRAIMKMDIQGYEARAFVHIGPLLDAIVVPYIYMEWLLMRESKDVLNGVQHMVKELFERDYRPYSLSREGATKLLPSDWRKWPLDIVWRHLPSAKEYSKLMKNHFLIWP